MTKFLSYFCFYLGDLVIRFDWLDRGIITARVYQWLMLKSSNLQDDCGQGPWK